MGLSSNPTAIAVEPSAAVAGVRINLASLSAAVAKLSRESREGRGFTLFTLNLDHIVKLRRSAAFRAAYSRATYVTADGWPVVWLANRGAALLRRTAGADLVEPLCEAAARHALGLYFVGPGAAAQSAALDRLRERYRGLQIVGAESPIVSVDDNAPDTSALAGRITKSNARICFVSLGAPKQELIAAALSEHCPGVGFVCVGAALDFISGQARRAPRWMRQSGLEWFWRLAGEPRRLAARYCACAWILLLLALGVKAIPEETYS